MANPEHERILLTGTLKWNKWRDEEAGLETAPDLSGIKLPEEYWLEGANLRNTDLNGAKLPRAILAYANLYRANLEGAELRGALMQQDTLTLANLRDADLRGASLNGANLLQADLRGANLTGADLRLAQMVRCKLNHAILTGCRVYGASVWDAELSDATQSDLIVSPDSQATVTTDNLEVAQFLYLLLNNQKIRHVIDTITSKVVLILGRFTPERKAILDAIRDELRKRDYLPVLFDFEKPANRDITETVSTLAHMARFIIADITDARSIPQELMAIVPSLPSVPVQPLLLASQREYGMFEHFKRYPWVLEPFIYEDQNGLLAVLMGRVIEPAEAMAKELTGL